MDEATRLLDQDALCRICYLATGGLLVLWTVFWATILLRKTEVERALLLPGFLQTSTVFGIVAATTVLALAEVLEGQVVATILSGIAGYVLGTTRTRIDYDGGRGIRPVDGTRAVDDGGQGTAP